MDWANYYKREDDSKNVEGPHRCVITAAEETESNEKKNPMVVVSVKPSGADFSVKCFFVYGDYFNRNITRFLDAFPNIRDQVDNKKWDFVKWVGEEGAAFFEKDGKYTKVKYFLSPERAKDLPPFEGSKPEKLEVSNEFTDINEDDLPF